MHNTYIFSKISYPPYLQPSPDLELNGMHAHETKLYLYDPDVYRKKFIISKIALRC